MKTGEGCIPGGEGSISKGKELGLRVATQHPTAHRAPEVGITANYRARRNEGWRGSLGPHYVRSSKN